MKLILSLVFTFCLCLLATFSLFCQNVFYDAKKLSQWIVPGTDINGNATFKISPSKLTSDSMLQKATYDSIVSILSKYFSEIDSSNSGNSNTITTILQQNPFFKNFSVLGAPHGTGQGAKLLNMASFASSIGGLDVTNIADGLAQFLIERGKEELNIAFFNQFKEFLSEHEECQILFPNTTDFLSRIDAYKYSAFLQSLRESFYSDLSNLIVHLNQVINLPKYDSLIRQTHPEIKVVIGSTYILSQLSQAGESIAPDSVIRQLAELPWTGVNKNLGNAINFLNVISQSIRESDASEHRSWVQLSELNRNLFFDSITLRIYFGLLYQQVQAQNITFYGRTSNDSIRVDTFLKRNSNRIYMLSSIAENFALLANDVSKTMEDYETKKGKQLLENEDYYTYINKAINIVDYGFKVANTIKPGVIDDKYISIARNANDLYKNIYTKNYQSAVMNVYVILDSLLSDATAGKILPGILKYGNFMATVVKAESPEEVKNAIAATALPAGSSSIKKNSAFNVSLNAYIGGYFGRSSNSSEEIDGNNSSVGVTAPIGVAISWGLGYFKNGNSIGSLSLYGTLIDVGAIAGYRLNDDSTALDQKVTLGDIFTPGGYLVYGIGLPFKWASYVPLSVGYGWQYGSKLYQKQDDGKLAISDQSRWRSNWFVAVDIPLANFWTRGYKEMK